MEKYISTPRLDTQGEGSSKAVSAGDKGQEDSRRGKSDHCEWQDRKQKAVHLLSTRSGQPAKTHTHTHNRFTAGLEYVRIHPGQQVPER